MTAAEPTSKELLDYALSTWVYVLHASGVDVVDSEVKAQCKAIAVAADAESGNAAGEALVAHLSGLLADEGADSVAKVATQVFGDAVSRDLGAGDRSERTARIRSYQFAKNLPWLARIWERSEAGQVSPSWLVVERVTDQVAAMDPNPWNDIDEERQIPVADFHVLWELDACASVYLA